MILELPPNNKYFKNSSSGDLSVGISEGGKEKLNKDLYLKSCYQVSRLITNRYSTSFSLGISVFPKDIAEAVYGIYGFVRLADEIVDTFHDHDKRTLLERLRADTNNALENRLSLNPILHAFQDVVSRYNIPPEYIEAFLESMEMDLTVNRHSSESYDRYVYGSAEVIGLMCLKTFCRQDEALFEELQASARLLGSAFQKVNFLRDIKADWELRGRIYLPGVPEIDKLKNEAKRAIEEEIEKEFTQAFVGIKKLPRDVRLGVYSAYLYYQALLTKIKGADVQTLLSRRVRVSNVVKLMLLLRAAITLPFLR